MWGGREGMYIHVGGVGRVWKREYDGMFVARFQPVYTSIIARGVIGM